MWEIIAAIAGFVTELMESFWPNKKPKQKRKKKYSK